VVQAAHPDDPEERQKYIGPGKGRGKGAGMGRGKGWVGRMRVLLAFRRGFGGARQVKDQGVPRPSLIFFATAFLSRSKKEAELDHYGCA